MKKIYAKLLLLTSLFVAGGNAVGQTVKSAYVPTGYGSSVLIHYEVENEDAKTCKIVPEDASQAKGTISTQLSGKFDLPTEIDGYTVISIEPYAFGVTRCTIAKLPEKLQTIKNDAFRSTSDANSRPSFADTLYVPKSVVSISEGAFRKSYVNYVVLPEGLTKIDRNVFIDSYLKGITLPSTVKSIGAFAFSRSKLGKINLPEGLETIGSDAFEYTLVDSLLIPASCNSIGMGVTEGCNELVSLKVAEGNAVYDAAISANHVVYEISTNTVVAGCKKSVLPSTTVQIGEWAFAGIKDIEPFHIPASLKTIRSYAYRDSGIKYLVIPETVKELHDGAFENCDSLVRVDFTGNSKDLTLGIRAISLSGAVANNPKLTGVYFHDIYPAKVTADNFLAGMQNVTLYYPKQPSGTYNWFTEIGGYADESTFAHKPYTSFFKQGKEYKEVGRIDIVDFDWPTAGEYGDYDAASSTEGVESVEVSYAMYRRIMDYHNEKFSPSDILDLRMVVYLKEGYVFTAYPTAYIGDKAHEVRVARSIREDSQTFDWEATPLIPEGGILVESLSCSLPAPVVGDVPAEYITSPSGRFLTRGYFAKYEGAITWSPLHVTFREGVVYTAKVKVSCGEDYTFGEGTVTTVNGKTAQLIPDDFDDNGRCHEATIAYTFHIAKAISEGDVDRDGRVNSADVVSVYNYIIEGDASGVNKEYANVDKDEAGNVNSADVVSIYNYIINGTKASYSFDGIPITLVDVEGGPFIMGSPEDDYVWDDELPQHRVTLSDFQIGQTEVTQGLWEAVMGYNNGSGSFDPNYKDLPVNYVSWDECQLFIRALNEAFGDRLGDKRFRLPTEAEWEYAASGGQESKEYTYAGSNDLDEVAWYADNSGSIQYVAQKKPNELGIYDMSGNVEEWCHDRFGSYSGGSQVNPTGSADGSERVRRGGSRSDEEDLLRVKTRNWSDPDVDSPSSGFRLVLSNIILTEE